jgi:large subunit ribosomal protein L13
MQNKTQEIKTKKVNSAKEATTSAIKVTDVKKGWHFIDAEGKILGRLATDIAKILLGKNKAIFSPNEDFGDKVVITNAEKIKVTGKKLTDKKYIWYTGFPHGLREEALKDRLKRNPTDVLRSAIEGMLPKNKLQKVRMRNLYVYAGTEHPHTAHNAAEKKVVKK